MKLSNIIQLLVGFVIGWGVSELVNTERDTRPEVETKALEAENNQAADAPQLTAKSSESSEVNAGKEYDKNAAEVIRQLEQRLQESQQRNRQLVKANNDIENELAQIRAESETGAQNSSADSVSESMLSDEDFRALVPAPYDRLLGDNLDDIRDQITTFHEQEKDYAWGYEMELNIRDYFQLLDPELGITLFRVSCKQNACELLFNHRADNNMHEFMDGLRSQEWWQFTSSHSSSSNGENENEIIVYMFAST